MHFKFPPCVVTDVILISDPGPEETQSAASHHDATLVGEGQEGGFQEIEKDLENKKIQTECEDLSFKKLVDSRMERMGKTERVRS